MRRTNSEILMDADISLNDMCNFITKPSKVYKYQGFLSIKNDNRENPFWKDNINGSFHLSLGCEFEDKNDCRPHINIEEVKRRILRFFKNCESDINKLTEIAKELDAIIPEDYVETVVDRYQRDILIGCFTQKPNNEYMWKEYADASRGFCIEYDTLKENLFKDSMLPIEYGNKQDNSSLTMYLNFILEKTREAKRRTMQENISIFPEEYARLMKLTYIPIFLKGERFRREEEWRMFVLNNRTYETRTINKADIVDSNNNINLKKAITAIYLGENFCKNPNFKIIKSQVDKIVEENNIRLYQMIREKEGLIYECIN
ncbi:DUF2971 domain-containing protein [Clostridium butyricum]|uniref:DUF2971 domain-containing protein n=1 Tax=Clostridium butyricum TaxID=1492 RepID=UPI00374F3975